MSMNIGRRRLQPNMRNPRTKGAENGMRENTHHQDIMRKYTLEAKILVGFPCSLTWPHSRAARGDRTDGFDKSDQLCSRVTCPLRPHVDHAQN